MYVISVFQLATLETRSNLGQVASRSRLWDRYLVPVTVPQATARCDSFLITSRFLKWQMYISYTTYSPSHPGHTCQNQCIRRVARKSPGVLLIFCRTLIGNRVTLQKLAPHLRGQFHQVTGKRYMYVVHLLVSLMYLYFILFFQVSLF